MKKLLAILSFATPLLSMHDERMSIDFLLNPRPETEAASTTAVKSTQTNQEIITPSYANSAQQSYTCPHVDCTYTTSHKSNLTRHLSSTHSLARFKCPYFGCTFTTPHKRYIPIHIRSKHTGEKPFHCEQPGCNFSCTQKGYLTMHKALRHRLNNYQCTICHEGFLLLNYAKRHIRDVHGIKKDGVKHVSSI